MQPTAFSEPPPTCMPGTEVFAVCVHMADLDALTPLEVLSEGEQTRANRYRFPIDRQRYVAARTFVRTTLGRYLCAAPSAIRFTHGDDGKPAIADPTAGLHFNLSHSGNLAILGVARGPVGVDIEHIDSLGDVDDLSCVALSSGEREFVFGAQGRERSERFYRCWTLKEAVAKAAGHGVSDAVNEIELAWHGGNPRLVHYANYSVQHWSLFTPHVHEGVCVAVAVQQQHATIEVQEWRVADGR